MPTETEIEERMPVWLALSEFFLDTQLDQEDHQRIAGILAATRFSERELEAILVAEVSPLCGGNLLQTAGEWSGWDPAWIRRNLSPRLGRRPGFLARKVTQRMYRRHWQAVRAYLKELRGD